MAWPYVAQEHFEDGTSARFTGAGSNGNSKLNVRHYAYLAQNLLYPDAMPFRGTSALHCNLALGTTDAYIQEDTFADMAASTVRYVRFYIYASGLVMAASDRFSIFQAQSAGPVSEASIDIRNNSGTLQILGSETGASATVRATDLIQDQWHCVELALTLDSGANDGTMAFFVDGYQIGATVTGLTHAAVVQARLGAMNIDAGTTAGHLLFDQFVMDDTRIFPLLERYPHTVAVTQSGHVAVGPGRLRRFTYASGGAADNKITVYDTDSANINAAQEVLVGLPPTLSLPANTVGTYEFPDGEAYFRRGVYVSMTGTDPVAYVTIDYGAMSLANLKWFATHRPPSSAV